MRERILESVVVKDVEKNRSPVKGKLCPTVELPLKPGFGLSGGCSPSATSSLLCGSCGTLAKVFAHFVDFERWLARVILGLLA